MSHVHSHYENLKVARDAPPEVIRAAYKTLSQKYHPDRNPGDDQAARIMTAINQAYEVLSDPQQKVKHDEWIAFAEADTKHEHRKNKDGAAQRNTAESAQPSAETQHPDMRAGGGILAHVVRYWYWYGCPIILVMVFVAIRSGTSSAVPTQYAGAPATPDISATGQFPSATVASPATQPPMESSSPEFHAPAGYADLSWPEFKQKYGYDAAYYKVRQQLWDAYCTNWIPLMAQVTGDDPEALQRRLEQLFPQDIPHRPVTKEEVDKDEKLFVAAVKKAVPDMDVIVKQNTWQTFIQTPASDGSSTNGDVLLAFHNERNLDGVVAAFNTYRKYTAAARMQE